MPAPLPGRTRDSGPFAASISPAVTSNTPRRPHWSLRIPNANQRELVPEELARVLAHRYRDGLPLNARGYFCMQKPAAEKTAITPRRDEDFPEWYQQVIRAAELAESSDV